MALVGVAGMTSGALGARVPLAHLGVWRVREIGGIAPNTDVGLLLLGLALALLEWEPAPARWPGQWAALAALALGGAVILGYAYGVVALYQIPPAHPMALNSGLGIFFLALAILCARPDRGLCGLLTGDGTGSHVARRLLPAAVLIPVVPGGAVILGIEHRWYGAPVGTALLVIFAIVGMLALIWATAARVEQADQRRRLGELVLAEQYRRAEEARREVTRTRSDLISWVSHELRTPLTSIKGFLDVYREDYELDMTGEQREILDIVQGNTQRLIVLINDLLEVNRMDAGAVELRRAPTDLGELIRQAARAARAQIDGNGQRLSIDLPAALPLALVDADRIGQVLTNLLSNAHKYTPAGGAITVQAAEDGGWLRVAVRDTGIGMTPEVQARLFTRFFRATDPVTTGVGGSGLGLVIARSLIELHGGRMDVESVQGAGSTFRFTLPIAPAR